MVAFNPATDIPSLAGKVVLVTGANAGIGRETVVGLAQHGPSKIFLACRNATKANEAIADIEQRVPNGPPLEFLELDLASLESVRQAAATFLSKNDRLDFLINNAGLAALPLGETKDGNEIQLGVNHLGHFLLTKLLLPALQKAASEAKSPKDVRVINISSIASQSCPTHGIDFDNLNITSGSWGAWMRYGQSKLANVLFTRELAVRYPEFTSLVVHPGMIDTDVWQNDWTARLARFMFRWYWYDSITGSYTTLWAASAENVTSGDLYYPIGKLVKGDAPSNDIELAKKLWDWSEERVKEFTAI
jgi:NAD(P)-dependent dehydrogenase (short-subunit alcohol dehydrogenase family)